MKRSVQKKLVLISMNSEDREFGSLLATSCKFQYEQIDSFQADEVTRLLNEGDTVIVDSAISLCLEDEFLDSLKESLRSRIHYICDPANKLILETIFNSKMVHNLIYRKYPSLPEAAKIYSRIVNISYVDLPFGLKQYFGEDVHLETTTFKDSGEKRVFTDSLTEQLSQWGYNHFTVPAVTNAVDELLMNAMYDAPVDTDGNQIYAYTPRSTNIPLSGRQSVELQIAGADDLLGIAVSDYFGSLDSALVRKHIAKSLSIVQQSSNENDPKKSGGLGLSLIQRSGGSLFFVCKKGEKTEVTVFFKKTERHRDLAKQFQFISIRMVE